MSRLRYPFLALMLLSAAAAAALLAAGAGRERRLIRAAAFARDKVAVVEISGVLSSSHDLGERATSARRVTELIEKYAGDDAVRAVVLRIDSPGGTVVAAQEIHGAVSRLRRQSGKKVVVSMADVAASGGYYIACAADRVFASPGTLTGSIGVIMQFPNLQGLLGKIGVGTTTIKSGEFKDLGNSFRETTERDRRVLQGLVDDVYAQFVAAVAEGRGLPVERVRAIADGRIYSGRQAKELGLVDELGDLDAAIATAARLGGVRGKPQVVRERPRKRLWEMLDARIASLAGLAPGLDGALGQPRLLYLWQ